MSADSGSQQDLSGSYVFDGAHSRFGFVARHAMVTKVRGSFLEFEGGVEIDESDPTRSSGRVTIKAASIDTGNEQRDGHLRSNDFFDMETYPELSFVSTGIERSGDDEFKVTGDLTIKDVTKHVTVEVEFTGAATDPFGNPRIGFEGKTVINRKDWGVSWNAPLEAGGVLVSDKVTIEVDISAIKARAAVPNDA